MDLIDDIKEKSEELKVEVQGSPLPTEVRKMFRMFIVFNNKAKKENPIFRLFWGKKTRGFRAVKSEYGTQRAEF